MEDNQPGKTMCHNEEWMYSYTWDFIFRVILHQETNDQVD